MGKVKGEKKVPDNYHSDYILKINNLKIMPTTFELCSILILVR